MMIQVVSTKDVYDTGQGLRSSWFFARHICESISDMRRHRGGLRLREPMPQVALLEKSDTHDHRM